MAGITVNQGTQSNLSTDLIGTVNYGIIKLDMGALGASVPFTGTLPAVTALGTLGTLGRGTVDSVSQLPPNNWGTSINTAGTAFGTLRAAAGGSVIYITDLEISMAGVAGTVALYNGANTNLLAGSWAFNPNGGIVTNRRTPIVGLAGSAICYQQQGTASLSITVAGFIR